MRLGPVDPAERVAVVAEVGNNHEGDVGVARELVHAAADAGAHAVKFQYTDPRGLVRPTETARIAQLDRYLLSPEEFAELRELAASLGLGFSCTPFDLDAVGWLSELVDVFKIASGDNDLVPLLEAVARSGRPVIVSTGMSDRAAARLALDVLRGAGATEVAFLHCVSAYPTPPEEARLSTIGVLRDELGTLVGYSDHTLGIDTCVSAVAAGARILEKHLTLRHDFSDFRDHQLSAEPSELRALVQRVAEVEAMLGTPKDGVLAVEEPVAVAARRSAAAASDLPAGHVLRAEDVWFLRPGGGVAPPDAGELTGRALARDVAAGEPLGPEDLG